MNNILEEDGYIFNNPIEIEVFITQTLSKSITIKTDKYNVYFDEEGEPYISLEGFDYKNEIRDQIITPENKCKNWNLDEFIVEV